MSQRKEPHWAGHPGYITFGLEQFDEQLRGLALFCEELGEHSEGDLTIGLAVGHRQPFSEFPGAFTVLATVPSQTCEQPNREFTGFVSVLRCLVLNEWVGLYE